MKLDNNTKIGALDHLRGCELPLSIFELGEKFELEYTNILNMKIQTKRKYEHLEYAIFELGEKFEDAYNVLLDDRWL